MDEGFLSYLLVLAASYAAFANLCLRFAAVTYQPWRFSAPQSLLLAAVIAASVALTGLLLAQTWTSWLTASPLFLAHLAALLAVAAAAHRLYTASPKLTRWLASPFGLFGRLPVAQPDGLAENVADDTAPDGWDEQEREMIRSVMRLDEYNARDIMAPRMDIVAVDVTEDISAVVNKMLESGHSRLPVYRDTLDDMVGVVHSRRLMPLLNRPRPWPALEELVMQPFFVPETKPLAELLSEFQGRHAHMALVVDEHGGTEGLVTLEDLLEEIVGEIEDEFSRAKDPIVTPTADGKLIVDAGLSLNDLEDHVAVQFERDDVDTIGGLVYSGLGKMPQAGDEVVYMGLRIKVLSMVGRRLQKLQLAFEPNPELEAGKT